MVGIVFKSPQKDMGYDIVCLDFCALCHDLRFGRLFREVGVELMQGCSLTMKISIRDMGRWGMWRGL